MSLVTSLLFFIIGALIGSLFLVWAYLRPSWTRIRDLEKENQESGAQLKLAESKALQDLKHLQEKLTEYKDFSTRVQTELSDRFQSLSSQVLRSQSSSFLELAKTQLGEFNQKSKSDWEKSQTHLENLLTPLKTSLEKMDEKVTDLEKNRVGAYAGMTQQIQQLLETQEHLRTETNNLVRALRSPSARGRWGEIQLRRVVEIAGMMAHCDFYEQQTVATEDSFLRPDLLVKLPGSKSVVVDSKAPLAAYLDALETQDDAIRHEKLLLHAQQLRTHIGQLSRKNYWEQFDPSPEFVVLFLPSEAIFGAALEKDPTLIEAGVEQKVLLATPTTLIALLRAVAYGWRHESLAENARHVSELGKELFKRLSDMHSHFARLGKSLGQSVEAYNRTIGTFESRVLVSARKFQELEVTSSGDALEVLEPLESQTRELSYQDQPPSNA